MRCVVVYDIPEDRLRAKVADICLDYGLERIQFSAFVGNLAPSHQQELMMKVRKRVGKREANVQLFPLCERDWEKRITCIQAKKEKETGSPSGSAT